MRGRTWTLLAIFLIVVAGVLALPGPAAFRGAIPSSPRYPSKTDRNAQTPRGVTPRPAPVQPPGEGEVEEGESAR